jgi:hypothetical protein
MIIMIMMFGILPGTGVVMANDIGEPISIEEKAWSDWPDTDIAAGFWVKEKGYFGGYADGTFKPNLTINSVHFWSVLNRAGIKNATSSNPATIADALRYLPNAQVTSKPTDTLTRYRMAAIMYRHFVTPMPVDEAMAAKVNQLISEHRYYWNGALRTPRIAGMGAIIVADSKQYGIPIWLCLAQGWIESCWFQSGLATDYNCGFGIKSATNKWGQLGNPPTVKGFANYVTVEESIHAYFRLVGSPNMPYKKLIDAGNIKAALEIYAPPYENDTDQMYRSMMVVKGWVEKAGIK